ncbi:MAG: hypothetical protein F6J90_25810 [Moorea sp. SIOASIH]|nr:hypothetical protein [Moorena sp. SIOASIH]
MEARFPFEELNYGVAPQVLTLLCIAEQPERLLYSYGNYRQRRRLAVGHAKGEREQTTLLR